MVALFIFLPYKRFLYLNNFLLQTLCSLIWFRVQEKNNIQSRNTVLASGQWQFMGNPIDGAGEVFCSTIARRQRQFQKTR